MHFDDLIASGSMAVGKARTESNDYVTHDGDVSKFHIKV